MEKVPTGIWYMMENLTTKTDGTNWDSGVPAGYDANTKKYVVLVGDSALTIPTDKTGTVWADDGVLANITEADITAQTGNGTDAKKYAIFQIDGDSTSTTYGKAITTPDIATFGIMNTAGSRKVILRKVDGTSYTSLESAWFRIFTFDMQEIKNSDWKTESGKSGYKSLASGVYFIDTLPVGKYYLVETVAPTKAGGTDTTAYSTNVGKVFSLEVTTGDIGNPTVATTLSSLTDVPASLKTWATSGTDTTP